MSKFNTFWNVVNSIGIEIPPIQRDYAQGRNNGRIPAIRKKFIDSIFTALKSGQPLGLDFIYGKIHGIKNDAELRRSKHGIEVLIAGIREYAASLDLAIGEVPVQQRPSIAGTATYLVPLDGQQRLTTLFLIHWYVVMRLGRSEDLQILKRFRYKTRKSTEDFLNLLCDLKSLQFGKLLDEEIMGCEAFSNTWMNDPTVASMLTVIQEVHTYCCEKHPAYEYQSLWNALVESETVHFDFLNLKDFNLADELYVKMNARGKQLSDFENFKAWLFGKIDQEHWYPASDWAADSMAFELSWNDLFWDNKDNDVFEIDTAYFNYFKLQHLIDTASNAQLKGTAFHEGSVKDVIDAVMDGHEAFEFENIYDHAFGARLPTYFQVLKNCVGIGNPKPEVANFQQFFFNTRGEIKWVDLIEQYIVLAYVEVNNSYGPDSDHFRQYYRVVKNLFQNQTFDNALLYQRALNDIYTINQKIKEGIQWDWITEFEQAKDNAFTKEQLAEERQKTAMIAADDCADDAGISWEELITGAEAHPYFKGKIGFLLKLSNDNKASFQRYYNRISPLFKDDLLSHKEWLFQRALLTYGNYFIDKGSNRVSFCINDSATYRARRENWLQVLGNDEKLSLLKSLVDDVHFEVNYIERSLTKIIDLWKEANPLAVLTTRNLNLIPYIQLYVFCPKLFLYGDSSLIKVHKELYAYQLNSSKASGYLMDVLCEFIKRTIYADNENIKSIRERGWDNKLGLEVGKTNRAWINADLNCFEVDFEGEHRKLDTIKELADFIEDHNPVL